MKTDSKFFLTTKKFWKTVVNKETVADKQKLQDQIEFYKRLLNIFHAGDFYYYVFSMYTSELDLVGGNVKQVLGYEPDEFKLDLIMNIIHPEDNLIF